MGRGDRPRASGSRGARAGAVIALALGGLALQPAAASGVEVVGGLPASTSAQIQALTDAKAERSPTEQKLDSNLLAAPAAGRDLAVSITGADVAAVRNRVEALGGAVDWAGGDQVDARLAPGSVADLAEDPAVLAIRPTVLGESESDVLVEELGSIEAAADALSQGGTVSEGDTTLGAVTARENYAVDGTGVKVCALSGGIKNLASVQASGDLPAVQIIDGSLPANSFEDGGIAMLEVIHDLAPGATLGYANGSVSQAQFAEKVLDLADAGCTVIVDDLTFRDERQFQDSTITQAISTVKAAGVTYVTSAGNGGNKADGTATTWQGDFSDGGAAAAPLPSAGQRLHQWSPGVTQNAITSTAATTHRVNLEWTDVSGASANDYDLYVLNASGAVVGSSTNLQTGTQQPYEYVEVAAAAGAQYRVVVVKAAGAASRYLRLSLAPNGVPLAVSTGGSFTGHHAAPDAIAVAATPTRPTGNPPGPYPGLHTGASVSEKFSSDGPARRYFLGNGTAITPGNVSAAGGSSVPGPLVTSADFVSVSAPAMAPLFGGTSSSAAHLAGLAALAKQAKPTLTPDQLQTALAGAAIDIEGAGRDAATGHGIVMAPALLANLGATGVGFLAAPSRTVAVSTGNAGSAFDPGETVDVVQTLKNTGLGGATAISATLTTTSPDIAIGTATVSYANLAPGASGTPTNGPLRFTITKTCTCATVIRFTITVTYTAGATKTRTIPFEIVLGTEGTTVHRSYTGPEAPIPERGWLDLPLQFNEPGSMVDATISIDGTDCTNAPGIEHSAMSDVFATLVSPSGQYWVLFATNTARGRNMCQAVFTDAAASGVERGIAPFTGSWKPFNRFGLSGETIEGPWFLRIADQLDSGTGTVSKFSIHLTPRTCVVHGGGISAPGAPTGVSVSQTGRYPKVSWTAPASTGGSPVVRYVVTPYLGSVPQYPVTTFGPTTSVDVNGLSTNKTYTFKVHAVTSVGSGARSAASASYVAKNAPAEPTGLTVVPGDGQVTVSWTAPTDDGGSPITSYVVKPRLRSVGSMPNVPSPGTGTSKVVTGLQNGERYAFYVSAVNAYGEGFNSVRSVEVTPSATAPKPYAPFTSWASLATRVATDLTTKPLAAASQSSWVSQLTAGTKTKGDLADALRRGSENLANVDPVVRVYRAFLGRAPDAGGLQFWIKRKRNVAPAKTWSVTQIATEFTNSNEFKTKYGSLTNRQFVTQIYTDVLGRTADPSGVNYWTGKLDRKEKTKAQVVVGFSESNEYKTKQAQNTDVAVAYIYLMGRAPTTAEASDWVTRQKAGTTHAALLTELLNSAKYATHITG